MFKKLVSLILIFSLLTSSLGTIKVEAVEDSQTNMIKEYLDIVISMKEKYGIVTTGNQQGQGFYYADLIDFDGDGNEELLCLYKESDVITYEVWEYMDDGAEKIHTEGISNPFLRGNKTLYLVSKDNKNYILQEIYAYGLAGIDGINIYEAYTIENGQWIMEEGIEHSYLYKEGMEDQISFMEDYKDQESGDFYKIIKDGRKTDISEKQYNEGKEKYLNSPKIDLAYLGHGGAGTADVPSGILEDKGQVIDFIEDLKQRLIPNLQDIYKDKSKEEKREIIDFLSKYRISFSENQKMDITNPNQEVLARMIYLIFAYYPKIIDYEMKPFKNDGEPEGNIYVYKEEEFNNKISDLVGTNVDFKRYYPENYTYKEGYVEIEQNMDVPGNIIPIINSMHELGDGLFYLTIEGFIYEQFGEIESYEDNITDSIFGKILNKESDEFYQGLAQGYVMFKEVLKDGKPSYELIKYNVENGYLTEEDLSKYITKVNPGPNIIFDYSKVESFIEKGDYVDYFKEMLDSLDGEDLNDNGNMELVKYIEYVIESFNTTSIESKRNQITIDKNDLKEGLNKAQDIKTEFDKILKDRKMSSNKEIETILKVNGERLNSEKAMSIILDKSIKESLGSLNGIRILLGDNQHTIYLNSNDTKILIDEIGDIAVQIQKEKGKDTYSILFIDESGKEMEELGGLIGFSLPANSEFATIFANYKGGSDNWGGQYNDVAKSIEFSTKYSGEYTILEEEINIIDIEDLSEDQKRAIRFMVSKGYFDLEEGRFNGQDILRRYDFTTALVKIFFALDRDLETGFIDLEKSNKYYPYIASAEKDDIVKGFEDNTFRGEKNTLKEEVIAICGRTLADKKGYVYPENTEDYLKFVDEDVISDWAKADISIAVKNELIDNGGILMPQGEITRIEGAEVLYNLFMLLYDNPPIAVELEKEKNPIRLNGIIVSSILSLGVLGSGFHYFKRKGIRNRR